ncbi:3-isopropylmalate dehydrogenase [Qipengyuania psychrotolerans]|uniref:3-isopropylmalate dehydrogenase n=1 Tax=Qipengyuania psychrotolerans TaxID=2867238 RepID=A0ABX8ZK71_9SPHN|nr:3-isopropylmalate dehydrogenase [Qipengyuania psychrotolerans]QZD87922.1 3-isopropylmalate dehydrogenase [Qipengyuania psychrotolerans]
MKIAVLPGDGIGPEVTRESLKVLDALSLPQLTLFEGDVGGIAYKRHGHPLPSETLDMARAADAVLFGAVGDPECDSLPRQHRPEQAILGLRSELGLFANLRPAAGFPGLEDLSPLKPELARGIDLLVVRELNGDVYFGEKGERESAGGREGWDAMSYNEAEVERIAHTAFRAARKRRKKLTSVDKANVLETSRVWREVVVQIADQYPDVELDHMYVDNAAMQLVRSPGQFDVILTGNLFGDILSDQASACVGSIGLLASASLGERQTDLGTFGLYEPIHGSAPDIAGQGKANPVAAILSLAMLLRHSLGRETEAGQIERAVANTLTGDIRGADLGGTATTQEIGDAVIGNLKSIA